MGKRDIYKPGLLTIYNASVDVVEWESAWVGCERIEHLIAIHAIDGTR